MTAASKRLSLSIALILVSHLKTYRKLLPVLSKFYPYRWIVERTWGWLINHRRLQIDYERDPAIIAGFVSAAPRTHAPTPPHHTTPQPHNQHKITRQLLRLCLSWAVVCCAASWAAGSSTRCRDTAAEFIEAGGLPCHASLMDDMDGRHGTGDQRLRCLVSLVTPPARSAFFGVFGL